MKKKYLSPAILGIFMLVAGAVFSQRNAYDVPAWVSNNGYWVLEASGKNHRKQLVRFYNNAHTLVATKDLAGVRLNIKRRKAKMRLKEMLELALQEWAARTTQNAGNTVAGGPQEQPVQSTQQH